MLSCSGSCSPRPTSLPPFSPGLSHHVVQASCESGGIVGRGLTSTRESSHPFLLVFPLLFLLFSTPYLKSNPTWDLEATCQPLFPKPQLNSFPRVGLWAPVFTSFLVNLHLTAVYTFRQPPSQMLRHEAWQTSRGRGTLWSCWSWGHSQMSPPRAPLMSGDCLARQLVP